jgi:hypothetical protein
MFQKDRVARNLIKFYKIFQKQSSPVTFEQVCDRYLRANLEVIEREKQLADRVNEIQIEFQDMGEQQFMSKYATN